MAAVYTTPRTWVVGETVTAAELNVEVRDALNLIQSSWSYVQHYGGNTTDASGFVTQVHTAGFTPLLVHAYSRNPAGAFCVAVGTDTYSSTGFRVRFANWSTSGAYVSAATGPFSAVFWK